MTDCDSLYHSNKTPWIMSTIFALIYNAVSISCKDKPKPRL